MIVIEMTLLLVFFYAVLLLLFYTMPIGFTSKLACFVFYTVFYVGMRVWRDEIQHTISPFFRSMACWNLLHAYFNVEMRHDPNTARAIHGQQEVKHSKRRGLLLLAYPHGIMPLVSFVAYALHGTCTARIVDAVAISPHFFWPPLVSEFCTLSGAVPARTSVIRRALSSGKKRVMVFPEGARATLLAEGGKIAFEYEKHRLGRSGKTFSTPGRCHGLLGWAHANRVPVVPVVNDGAYDLFRLKESWGRALRHWMIRNTNYCFPLFGSGPWPTKLYVTHVGFVVDPNLLKEKDDFLLRFAGQLSTMIVDNMDYQRLDKQVLRWAQTETFR